MPANVCYVTCDTATMLVIAATPLRCMRQTGVRCKSIVAAPKCFQNCRADHGFERLEVALHEQLLHCVAQGSGSSGFERLSTYPVQED